MHFFYTVPHPFPQTDRQQERLQKESVERRILKQKNSFFFNYPNGNFLQNNIKQVFLSFFFCEILML